MGRTLNTGRTWFKKGNVPWNIGIKHSEETRARMREANKKASTERMKKNPKPWHDEKWLRSEYLDKKKSCAQIGRDIGHDASNIRDALIRFGIPARNFSEAAKLLPHKRGNRSNNWIGGIVENGSGYTQKYIGNINGKTIYRMEHILIAEKALGRSLKKDECVHHINGDKKDNRNANLLLCTNSYHQWLERRMSKLYKQEHFGGCHG